MAYDKELAARVRDYLGDRPEFDVVEKKMFGGLAFMVFGKMCINVSGDRLMCRFDPERTDELSTRPGFIPMIMRNREYKGYCYVEPFGFQSREKFEFWLELCLEYNYRAKSSRKTKNL